MKKLFFLLLSGACLTVNSFAQDAPSDKISKGTKVKILEISSEDSYYDERVDFLGKNALALGDLSENPDGYYSGTLEVENGRTCFFKKIKVSVTSASATKTPKYITGTIAVGTSVYVADISPDDSYYANREKYIGRRGKVVTASMNMKEDGYFAGNFIFDDSTTAYFYKAKFSKEPVDKLSVLDLKSSSSGTSASTMTANSDDEWSDAKNDDDIKEGDRLEITAISPDDSYYDDKEDYLGRKGIAGDDLEFDDESGGYSGTVILDVRDTVYFYLIKLKKISSESSTTATTSLSELPKLIEKGTKVVVTDLGKEDALYYIKDKYIGKTGKVAEGLKLEAGGYYSGRVLFDDGTDNFFFNARVTVL